MKKSIQISEPLIRQLEILSSNRGLSYDEIISDLTGLFVSIVPFKDSNQFKSWFEQNLEEFGFRKIIEKQNSTKSYYVLEDVNGNLKKVGVELLPEDFLRRGCNIEYADLLVCFFSSKDKLGEVPILSVIQRGMNVSLSGDKPQNVLISIPASLFRRIKLAAGNAGFASVSGYATFLLRASVAIHEHENRPEHFAEDLEQAKKRLKDLGYID